MSWDFSMTVIKILVVTTLNLRHHERMEKGT